MVGGRGGARTPDPLLAKQMLSQLSYTPAAVAHCEADPLVGSSRACCIGNLTQPRSEEHTSELQSLRHLVCRLLLEKKKTNKKKIIIKLKQSIKSNERI